MYNYYYSFRFVVKLQASNYSRHRLNIYAQKLYIWTLCLCSTCLYYSTSTFIYIFLCEKFSGFFFILFSVFFIMQAGAMPYFFFVCVHINILLHSKKKKWAVVLNFSISCKAIKYFFMRVSAAKLSVMWRNENCIPLCRKWVINLNVF